MPELPEVETVRRGLEPVLAGARFVRVEQRRADLRFPFPDGFAGRLEGQTVIGVERRSKYIQVGLSGGEVLVIHLGMTGRLSVAAPKCRDNPTGTYMLYRSVSFMTQPVPGRPTRNGFTATNENAIQSTRGTAIRP